jgi:adhesion exoprotein
MRKKSSKNRFKVASTSVLAAVLISLSLNSSKVYVAEENVEVTTENVNENERNLPEVRTRAVEGDGDDIVVLPKVPTPVTPGVYADRKEVGEVEIDPNNGDIDIEEKVNYIALGKVQLVDKATGNVIAQQVYTNDPIDATKAARTKLPKVPEGYKFVSENLTLQNSAIEKVTKVHKGQGGGKEIIKSEITLTKVGDDLFFDPTNDQVQPLVDGASFSYSQGNNVIFYIVKNEPEKPAEEPNKPETPKEEPKKPEPKKPEPKRENPAPKRGLPKTDVETTSVVVPTLGAILAGFAFRRNRKNK